MSNKWNSGIHDRKLKEEICEIGRRVYNRGFAAANDGNISIRVGENEVLCSPTMICKGFMKPEDICAVDMDGNQIAGKRKRTSEILLHLEIMRNRPDVKACVHCHPPHATAFAVAGEAIPQCILPEIEVFMGEVPIAPYETPGGQDFASTVTPFLKSTNTIILKSHGMFSFGKSLEDAYWKTGILDAYCRILFLARERAPRCSVRSIRLPRTPVTCRRRLTMAERALVSIPRNWSGRSPIRSWPRLASRQQNSEFPSAGIPS